MHNLLYICQIYYIKYTGHGLFEDSIMAWDFGASIPNVDKYHAGKENVNWHEIPIDIISDVDQYTKKIIISILKTFSGYSNIYLSEWCQNEPAYKKARGTGRDYMEATPINEITESIIKEFYSTDFKK